MVDKGGDGGPQTKNPMFKCRVFVGNLPTDYLSKTEVEDRFSKYGPVMEVSLHRGFAFIQFKNQVDAVAAIKGEKGSNVKGSEIDCSFAKHERGSNKGAGGGGGNGGGVGGPGGIGGPMNRGGGMGGGRNDDRNKDRIRDFDRDRFGPPSSYDRDRPFDRDGPLPSRGSRDRSPLRDRYDDRFRDTYHRDDILRRDRLFDDRGIGRDSRDLDSYDRDRDRLPFPPRDTPLRRDDLREDPYLRDRDRDRDIYSRDREDPYRRDREPLDREPFDRDRDLFRDRDRDLRDRDPLARDRDPLDRRGGLALPAPPPVGGGDPSLDGPIDCEIIVVNKAQRDYAETVQRRIKHLQVSVGIIYLNTEMNLSTALDDVSRRGVLYAIVLTSQHEMHKSVTVNILHGTPQEHRNMPLEDAMGLIGRNFDRYMQNLREKNGLPPGPVGPPRGVAPPPISPPQRADRQPAPPTLPPVGGNSAPLPAAGGNIDLTIPQLLNLLADGKQLTIDELARVIEFLQELRQRMIRDQGGVDPQDDADAKDSGMVHSGSHHTTPGDGYGGGGGGGGGTMGRKEVDMDLDSDEDSGHGQGAPLKPPTSQNAQIQAKILNMIRPGGESPGIVSKPPPTSIASKPAPMQQGPPLPASMPIKKDPVGMQQGKPPQPPASVNPPGGNIRAPLPPAVQSQPPLPPTPMVSGGGMMRGPRPVAPPTVTSGNINFDNPNVKKALDNLIQSGPNLLRTIGQVSSSSATPSTQAAAAQAVSNLTAAQQQQQQALQAQYAQYQAAQQNAMMQAQMQAHAAYRQMNPAAAAAVAGQQQQQYMQHMMQGQQPPRYGGPY